MAHKAIKEAIRHVRSSLCVTPAGLMENGHAAESVENMVWAWNWNWLAFFFFLHSVKFKPVRFALSDGKCFISEIIGFTSELFKDIFGFLKVKIKEDILESRNEETKK